jgi:hypothetical protein
MVSKSTILTSYTMQYLFNVQRQIAGNWVVEAGYLGTVSHHLYGFLDANQAFPYPAAFVEAPPGFFGHVGRNTITGPGIANIDFEVHKQFRMVYNEHHSLQFRLEAFNALNHPNWKMPTLNILAGSAFAGQPGTNAHQSFGVVGRYLRQHAASPTRHEVFVLIHLDRQPMNLAGGPG